MALRLALSTLILADGPLRREKVGVAWAQEGPYDVLAAQLVEEECPAAAPAARPAWQALTVASLEARTHFAGNFGFEPRWVALGHYLQALLRLFVGDLYAAFQCPAVAAHHLQVAADWSVALDHPFRARVLMQLGHAFKFQALKEWSMTFHELKQRAGELSDATLASMPSAPPKRFLPRLHAEYQIAISQLHEALKVHPFDLPRVERADLGRIEVHSICAYKPDPTSKTGSETSLPSMSVANHRAYTEKHGYRYVVHTRLPLPDGVEAHYSKMVVVHNRFTGVVTEAAVVAVSGESEAPLDPPDWILFIDCDAFFTDFETSIEAVLKAYAPTDGGQPAHFFVAEDPGGINTGVFIIRNSQWSLDFLARVIRSTFTVAWDQSMFFWEMVRGALEVNDQSLATDFRYPWQTRLVHQAHLNAFVPPASRDWMAHEWRPGDFVRHFAGCPWQEPVCLRMMEETALVGHLPAARQEEILRGNS